MAQRAVDSQLPDRTELRRAISAEYEAVATDPGRGFHFHTGRRLTRILGYSEAWLDGIPEPNIESFAGTGNPFSIAPINAGSCVVDVGCGAGIDSFIAAKLVGKNGRVIGVDMTLPMLDKARMSARDWTLHNIEFKQGFMEELPVPDAWADIVISNGVLNLAPNKASALGEIARVLKPGGRLQVGDILVQRPVPESAKRKIDLWTG
jgi:SAM-dependent methyltransferase